jgi:hypothetical protein
VDGIPGGIARTVADADVLLGVGIVEAARRQPFATGETGARAPHPARKA